MAWWAFRVVVHCIATVALWSITWSMPAQGDPVSVAILTAMGYSGAAGLMAPTAVLGSLLWNAAVAALPTLLLNVVVGVGLTMLAHSMRPQPQAVDPGARIVNLRQAVQDRTRSYGQVRLGGPVAFWKAKDGRRYVAVLINTGEIDGFVSHYLDEVEVTLDSDGYVVGDRFASDGRSMVRIWPFRGAPGQGASHLLVNAFDEWTTGHRFAGIAGAVLMFRNPGHEDFAKVYPGGRELTWSSTFRGARVYDPRDASQVLGNRATYRYTTNAALIIADWCVDTDGLGGEVDWDEVAFEADVSDQIVLDRNGSPLRRWQLCGTYSLNQPRETVRQAMAIACDAFFYDRSDGKIGFHVGRWIEPRVTIRDEHIISIRIGEGQDGTDRPNAMSGIYTEPAAGYRQHASAAYAIGDGETYSEETFTAYWSPNHNQTVRVAKRVLRARRAQYDIQATLNLYGLALREERFLRLELAELGLSANFELASWTFGDDGMSVSISAKSALPTDQAFDAALEEPAMSEIGDITVEDSIADPENVILSSPHVGVLHVAFDPPPRPSLLKRVRYRQVGDTEWNEAGVPASQNHLSIAGLQSEEDFEAQVQFRTATARASDWVAGTPTPITIS